MKTITTMCVAFLVLATVPTFGQPRSEEPFSDRHVRTHLDLVYAKYGNREMHLDLFVPQQGPSPKPAVVVVHGGGWLKGERTKFHRLALGLATRGYVAAAIEYRLGGEAKFPAAIHDCNAAVRWLRANAKQYGIDPRRIAAVGGSAGGHLVGLMATGSHVAELQGDGGNSDQSSALQAAVVMAGPLELASGPVAEKSRNDPENSNTNKWLGKTVDEAPELYKLASATTHISKDTSPILFMTGELDNPQRNVATRERLRQLGIATGIQVYAQGKHGCWNQMPWLYMMLDDIDEFLRAALEIREADQFTWLRDTAWGEIRRGAGGLELRVESPPPGNKIEISPFDNPIGNVYVQADEKKSPLALKPGVKSWSIDLPPRSAAKPPYIIVVETKGLPRLEMLPRVVSAASDGAVVLAAHDAVTTGELLRYEPQPHKNTVGYWANEKDWVRWQFYLDQPGKFDLHVLQGCGKGQGGSEVAVTVGKQSVDFIVEDTGHFQNFKDRVIGSVELDAPGVYALDIRVKKKAANAVMDIRQVRLAPR
jgi:acetyl esterase/lipase